VRWPWRRSRPELEGAGAAERPTHLRLVKVGYARNLPEAEMMQGLLEQEGIESMIRRNAGFDVPDFLAAGARDVLVADADAERARELLS
jgi:hypothetical protein